jgi:SAM-dependent methyltransferase
VRRVSTEAADRLMQFLESATGRELAADGAIPATREATDLLASNGQSRWLEHERIDFPSYPHEWVPEMLADGGIFTVRIAQRLLEGGWTLKDATARNVLFKACRPVFVDLCSIVRWNGAPVWFARGQFDRHFVLPLLAFRHLHQPPNVTHLTRGDGISHEELYDAVGARSWVTPSLVASCALPAWLGRRSAPVDMRAPDNRSAGNAHAANMPVMKWNLASAARTLQSATRPIPSARSAWSAYWHGRSHYSDDDRRRKAQLVEEFLRMARPATLLDIGSNTGEYSRLAARLGAYVVAIESDLAAQRLAYKAARDDAAPVLPLLVDFANPTPALGWNGQECLSFDQRADDAFDCVMALAVVHHLLVSRGIPLSEIVDKLARYSKRHALIEYVAPQDPMFGRLSRQRGLDFSGMTAESFTAAVERRFRVIRNESTVAGLRNLLLCEKR